MSVIPVGGVVGSVITQEPVAPGQAGRNGVVVS